MLTTYTTAYYLVPKYLLQQRYLLFSLYTIYVLIFTAFLATVTMIGSFIFLSNLRVAETPPMSRNLIFIMILIYLVVGLVSFVHILKHNFNMLTQNKALENKILDTQLHIKQQELHYLKKQIHPHFLFNTLNTIYGFALRQSRQTPDIILKLSNLLDYILYQVQEKEVSLEDELKHIEEYLSLEEIRFQDTLEVSVTKQYNNPSISIPPMLFLPFVENSFKHGAILDGKLRILIDLKADDHELNFKIKNTFLNELPSEKQQGIGLPNIQKRLDLLFGKNYTLEVDTQESWYSVELNIKLNA